MTLGELYEACQLRIPIGSVPLPRNDDELGMAALAALDGLRLPVRELLKRNVASLYPIDEAPADVDPPLYVDPPSPDEMTR
jgi:membrane protein